MSYIQIFDTTLRDGEQSPGATMTVDEKLRVAMALSRLGVDAIEAGFPAASPLDLSAVRQISEHIGSKSQEGRKNPEPPVIAGLSRAKEHDIDCCRQALVGAAKSRIHLFIATSPIHRERKLEMTRKQILERIKEMVGYARQHFDELEFTPEDSTRTEPEYLYEAYAAAVEAGATHLNVADTVGYMTPHEFEELIAGIDKNVRRPDDVILSVHCHNDLGLATANTLAGIRGGARQVEVTINGIGERAGNTALEEVVMTFDTRQDRYPYQHGIDCTQLCSISRLVSGVTGMRVQPNKAIVGRNAFAHEAGIHQDGVLKSKSTYEIMRPESVGAVESKLVLGKHSGRHALKHRLKELGYEVGEERLAEIFKRFKQLADRKKDVTDQDLVAIVGELVERRQEGGYSIQDIHVSCGTRDLATATVTLRGTDGVEATQAAVGSGPVDAVFKAMESLFPIPCRLMSYHVRAISEGEDALGEASVRIGTENSSRTYRAQGVDQDVVVASAKAYLAAFNRLAERAEQPEESEESEEPVSGEEAAALMKETLGRKGTENARHVV